MDSPSDWIHLRHWSFPCLVGINRNEQERNQRLDVEVSLGLDLERAAAGDLHDSVHYGHLLDEVQFIAQRGHWKLLESMAHVLAVHLLSSASVVRRAAIEQVIIRLGKPEIFQGQAMPSVEIKRSTSWLARQSRHSFELGNVSYARLFETAHSGAYHVQLAPHQSFTVPRNASALVLQGAVAVAADRRRNHQQLSAGEQCSADSDEQTSLLIAARQPLSESP